MKEEPEDSNIGIWTGLGIIFSVLVIGLFARKVSVLILLTLSVGTLVGVIYYFLRYAWQWQSGREKNRTVEGKIEQLRAQCSDQIEKYRVEIKDIRHNIRDMDTQLNNRFDVNPSSLEESQRIKNAFLKEQRLRETKISFYETCRAKLENMLYNQRLAKDLEQKQEKLSQLQEDHFQDIARMEQLRSEVEYEKRFLDSIGQLSLRMAGINSQDTAEELQLELKEITKELRRL